MNKIEVEAYNLYIEQINFISIDPTYSVRTRELDAWKAARKFYLGNPQFVQVKNPKGFYIKINKWLGTIVGSRKEPYLNTPIVSKRK